jgi:hypothetical protein
MRHLGDVDESPPQGASSDLRDELARTICASEASPMELVLPVDAAVQSSVSDTTGQHNARWRVAHSVPAVVPDPGSGGIGCNVDPEAKVKCSASPRVDVEAFSGRGIVRPVAARFADEDDRRCAVTSRSPSARLILTESRHRSLERRGRSFIRAMSGFGSSTIRLSLLCRARRAPYTLQRAISK